jgi:phenylpropionate dioxygenase-like ring-hydroxylating dioxygenase large terminal subunit
VDAAIKAQLLATGRRMLACFTQQQADLADDIVSIDASVYVDPARFEAEKQYIFRTLPLMLAASCELAAAGDYKTLDVAGMPILLTRGEDGNAHAFLNSCRHRAGPVACDKGNASRFSCPYHGWTYSNRGDLIGIASSDQYGQAHKQGLRLIEFPLYESAGLIWVVLDPASKINISGFLGGFDKMLGGFDLARWTLYDQCTLPGANWKLAFDAHLDFYHLPVLHKETFGPRISNMAQYFFHGPHQRLGLMTENPVEQNDLRHLKDIAEAEWPLASLLFGEWIVFPNVSLNCFTAGEQVMVVSQIFPGDTPENSTTVQSYLVANPPSKQTKQELDDFVAFIKKIVGEEDLPMSRQQQKSISSGLVQKVHFGRNESGLQHYHDWIERLVSGETPDFFAEK